MGGRPEESVGAAAPDPVLTPVCRRGATKYEGKKSDKKGGMRVG